MDLETISKILKFLAVILGIPFGIILILSFFNEFFNGLFGL